jgi:hypothetical protein
VIEETKMNKLVILSFFMLIVSAVMVFACHEQVQVTDSDGNNLVGFDVKLVSNCSWGPGHSLTNTAGKTFNWAVYGKCMYTAEVITPPEGYDCNTGYHYNTGDSGLIKLICTKHEVPEFTSIGAGIAALGASAVYFIRKKK